MISEERIQKLMKTLDITREEALELEGYDNAVNRGEKTQYDLTPEQQKVARKMSRIEYNTKRNTGKRTRQPNEVKESIIAELDNYLREEAQAQMFENVKIENKSRKITFSVGEKEYELTLIEKRAPKK